MSDETDFEKRIKEYSKPVKPDWEKDLEEFSKPVDQVEKVEKEVKEEGSKDISSFIEYLKGRGIHYSRLDDIIVVHVDNSDDFSRVLRNSSSLLHNYKLYYTYGNEATRDVSLASKKADEFGVIVHMHFIPREDPEISIDEARDILDEWNDVKRIRE